MTGPRRPRAPKEPARAGPGLDLEGLRALIALMAETDVREVEWSRGDLRVVVRRGPVAGPTVAEGGARVVARSEAARPPTYKTVTAPMVGVFYRAPAPDAAPYVEEGAVVRMGQPLCIIEAMKLMNEIEAEFDGRVVSILVATGQPVEFGEPLFLLEPLAEV